MFPSQKGTVLFQLHVGLQRLLLVCSLNKYFLSTKYVLWTQNLKRKIETDLFNVSLDPKECLKLPNLGSIC